MKQALLPDHALEELRGEGLRRQLAFLRHAVEDATYELWKGGLSFRDSEALAREVSSVKALIARIERRLRDEHAVGA